MAYISRFNKKLVSGLTNPKQGYLPNITEHVSTTCGTPPSLNIVKNSQLFPAVQPTGYGGRWSSQLPESYLPHPTGNSFVFHPN